jgi:hypothetical protein
MLYHFEKGWKGAQSFRDLNELFSEGTISQSQVERWFKKFKSGDTNLEDEEGKGRHPISTKPSFWRLWKRMKV